MADKKIIIVVCLILVVGLSLINLIAFSSISGHKIGGLSVLQPYSAKSTSSSGNGAINGDVYVGNPESSGSDGSYASSNDVSAANSPSGSGGSSGLNSGGQETGDLGSSGNSSGGQETGGSNSGWQGITSSECLQNYSLSKDAIIFYYSNEVHSNTMKLIVQELQSELTFYWTNSLWNDGFNSCFGTAGATPTFVCAGTGEKLVGEIPKSILENFAGRCS